MIGLRHDVDNIYGLRDGLPKLIRIEEKFGIRSTIFVRTNIMPEKSDKEYIKQLEDKGWEIGLHLTNTINTSEFPSPKDELRFLRNIGLNIQGVTPCGQTIGWKGEVTWKTMDSLGLQYMEGYGIPDFETKTFVMPTHLTLDHGYVKKFGENKGYQLFTQDLDVILQQRGHATVLSHPEWFVRSLGYNSKHRTVIRLTRVIFTALSKRLMSNVYNQFLTDYNEKTKFMRYIDLMKYLMRDI
ncbi:MAG: hypothetical protein QXI71_03445 [Candidatus Bathyarchaeia archaeon]|nr:hypothetical protein [Candidatus Bathyarchaeota archaeon]